MPRKSPFHIDLSLDESTELNRRATRYTLPYIEVVRAKMILMAASGMDNDEIIAARLHTRREVVSQWRKHFFKERMVGLEERARPGRLRVFPQSSRLRSRRSHVNCRNRAATGLKR